MKKVSDPFKGSRRGRQEQEAGKEGKEEEQGEDCSLQRILREEGAQGEESCSKDESANERLDQREVN